VIFGAVATVLGGVCLILLYRVFKGPTVADRVAAGDSVGVILANSLALLSVEYSRSFYLDVAIVVGTLGFIGTLVIARMMEEGKL